MAIANPLRHYYHTTTTLRPTLVCRTVSCVKRNGELRETGRVWARVMKTIDRQNETATAICDAQRTLLLPARGNLRTAGWCLWGRETERPLNEHHSVAGERESGVLTVMWHQNRIFLRIFCLLMTEILIKSIIFTEFQLLEKLELILGETKCISFSKFDRRQWCFFAFICNSGSSSYRQLIDNFISFSGILRITGLFNTLIPKCNRENLQNLQGYVY